MDDLDPVYGILAIALLALCFVGLVLMPHPTQSVKAATASKPVPLPPAAQLQQQHPDWPIYYCQRIIDGKVSKGMTREMVILALGQPDRQVADSGEEILSYPYAVDLGGFSFSVTGKRQLVSLTNNIVTDVGEMSIYVSDLDNCIGWSGDTVLICYGPPSSVVEASGGDSWTYDNASQVVTLRFTAGGVLASWIRYAY